MNELRVNVGGNSSGYDAMMARVRRTAQDFTRSVSGQVSGGFTGMLTGIVSGAALAALAHKTMAYADDIEETSTRIGVGTQKLQEWSFGAKQAGAGIEQLTRFVEALTDAATDPKKSKALEAMGIRGRGMTPEQLFESVNRFARGHSSTEVRAALSDIVDTRRLGAMMNFLQSDLDALGKSARDAGAVMEEKLVHQAAALSDQFSVISQILYTQFAPALLGAAKFLLRVQGLVGGVASEAGAKTAGLSYKEMIFGPFAGKEEIEKIYAKVRNDPNTKIYGQTGENLFASKIMAIEEIIKLMENWHPAPLPTIGDVQGDKEKKERMEKASTFTPDALAKVGGYSASSVMFNPMLSVARDQLTELRAIRRGVETGGINGLF